MILKGEVFNIINTVYNFNEKKITWDWLGQPYAKEEETILTKNSLQRSIRLGLYLHKTSDK